MLLMDELMKRIQFQLCGQFSEPLWIPDEQTSGLSDLFGSGIRKNVLFSCR